MRAPNRALFFAVVLATLAASVTHAQPLDEMPARQLTGTLQRIKLSAVVRIGYRTQAIPFAYEATNGRPYGYSLDLCDAIVEDLAREIGVAALRTEYRRITAADRVEQVAEGRVDLECGASTNTAERRQRVAFSPPIFVSGTRLLVRRGSPVRSMRVLAGGKVAVVRGTTNATTMQQLAASGPSRFAVIEVDDYAQGVAEVADGRAVALAADDILITGYLAEHDLQLQYAVVGELLSYEPYGIMFARNDALLADAVEATLRRLAASGELRSIYNKWFLRSLPSGGRLGVPMSVQLERSFQVLGLAQE